MEASHALEKFSYEVHILSGEARRRAKFAIPYSQAHSLKRIADALEVIAKNMERKP